MILARLFAYCSSQCSRRSAQRLLDAAEFFLPLCAQFVDDWDAPPAPLLQLDKQKIFLFIGEGELRPSAAVLRRYFTHVLRAPCAFDRDEVLQLLAETIERWHGLRTLVGLCERQLLASGHLKPASLVVFDLDETIIDDGKAHCPLLYPTILEEIGAIVALFDYAVLWSHGGRSHVLGQVRAHRLAPLFDAVLWRRDDQRLPQAKLVNTCLARLNKDHGVTGFTFALLFDDTPSNNAGDYDMHYVVPRQQGPAALRAYYMRALDQIGRIVAVERCHAPREPPPAPPPTPEVSRRNRTTADNK